MSKLALVERETIISFNEYERTAYVYTDNKMWQKHFEKKLGYKPTKDNGFGGRFYEVPKSIIKPPKGKRVMSPKQLKSLALARSKKVNLGPVNSAPATGTD